MTTHEQWMQAALREARKGWGRTSPNPMVGAVVVADGELAGAGFHHQAGKPHAEVNALAAAGPRAKGADLYVTLEPCSTTGRTPPCTEAILAAGIRRVTIGCLDPNPAHQGKAVQILKKNGVEVVSGILKEKCQALNEAFFCWIQHGRPLVLLKMSMTLDGKIATPGGESKWISGDKARREVQKMRQWADAILVGGETVRKDDPELIVRSPGNWPCQPRKLVWTSRTDYPSHLKIFRDTANPPEFVHPDSPESWRSLLQELGRRQITALLVEGGGELAAAMLAADVVDKVAFFIGPRLLGGRDSRPVVGGTGPAALADARALKHTQCRKIGGDFLITGYLSDVYRFD
jgi:diaminohydroxyphosphoribosylaminopyrimidine deaminase/5-amino-6-(5-phosphoribosylamino)uracil reductase